MLDLLEISLAAAIRPWTFGGAEGRREEPEEQAQLCTAPGPGESHKQSLGGRDGGIGVKMNASISFLLALHCFDNLSTGCCS